MPNRAANTCEGEFTVDGRQYEIFWAWRGDWGEGDDGHDCEEGWYLASPNIEEGDTVGPFPTSEEARDWLGANPSWPST